MNMRRQLARFGWLPVVGSAALTASIVAAAFISWRAVQLEPLPEPAVAWQGNDFDRTTHAPAENPTINALLDKNPFHPERRRPAERYQLPAENGEGGEAAPPRETLVLAGTIVYPDGGGAAIIKRGGKPSQIVRRGAALGTLTLTSVERGKAIFTDADGSQVVLASSEQAGS